MKLKLLLSVMALAILVSMIVFFVVFLVEKTTFNSTSLTDWSGVFSVFNVLIASSLSFISLIILIVTLRNTQKMTEATFEALVNQKDDNYINQIENLCQRFNQTLEKENIVYANDIDCFFSNKVNEWYYQTKEWIQDNKIKSQDAALNYCKSISINYIGRINNETNMLLSILRTLNLITDRAKVDIAKAIVKDSISAEKRFWFTCMINEELNQEIFLYINDFDDFFILHENLSHKIFMQEIFDE
ncbi:MAG: hypothetical protein KA732_00710 [Providencia sp.]|uniref:hypothetical protein n=1 Tax=Providencia sp. TaxID=589 RepID=UPI001B472AC7|nr:hypothetical protein [Providencia sp.]MBP6079778.1 hypothetical protein [Providencia sp.]